MSYGTGSTGVEHAARAEAVINEFYQKPLADQTSAAFANLWSSRTVHWLDIKNDHVVGGGEANSAAGWWAYMKRLHGSTRNTSSGGTYSILGLPTTVYTRFTSNHSSLTEDGTGDVQQGKRVYEFLQMSTEYRHGQLKEILCAWAATGSSALGTS